MGEYLPIEEVRKRFLNEWVLLDDLDSNEQLDPLAGRVVFHSKDRDEVERMAQELKPKKFTVVFAGEVSVPAHLVTRL